MTWTVCTLQDVSKRDHLVAHNYRHAVYMARKQLQLWSAMPERAGSYTLAPSEMNNFKTVVLCCMALARWHMVRPTASSLATEIDNLRTREETCLLTFPDPEKLLGKSG